MNTDGHRFRFPIILDRLILDQFTPVSHPNGMESFSPALFRNAGLRWDLRPHCFNPERVASIPFIPFSQLNFMKSPAGI